MEKVKRRMGKSALVEFYPSTDPAASLQEKKRKGAGAGEGGGYSKERGEPARNDALSFLAGCKRDAERKKKTMVTRASPLSPLRMAVAKRKRGAP